MRTAFARRVKFLYLEATLSCLTDWKTLAEADKAKLETEGGGEGGVRKEEEAARRTTAAKRKRTKPFTVFRK